MSVLSIVVVAYRMSRQAENTLYTLSTATSAASGRHYEVVFVENASDDLLGEARALASDPTFATSCGTSPGARGAGLNFGVSHAGGDVADE